MQIKNRLKFNLEGDIFCTVGKGKNLRKNTFLFRSITRTGFSRQGIRYDIMFLIRIWLNCSNQFSNTKIAPKSCYYTNTLITDLKGRCVAPSFSCCSSSLALINRGPRTAYVITYNNKLLCCSRSLALINRGPRTVYVITYNNKLL